MGKHMERAVARVRRRLVKVSDTSRLLMKLEGAMIVVMTELSAPL